MQHGGILQRLGALRRMLHRHMQGQRIRKRPAGRLFEEDGPRFLLRGHGANVQRIPHHVRLLGVQPDLGGRSVIPSDGFSPAALQTPGQTAAWIPQHSLLPARQLKDASIASRRFGTASFAGVRAAGGRRVGNRAARRRAGTWARGRRAWRGAGTWAGGRGARRRRAKLQHPVQLIFQQHLVLGHRFNQGGDALVHRQHVPRPGARLRPRQRPQNILQFLTLGIEDMAQSRLLHGDGGDDHGQGLFTGHVRSVGGEGRHRHMKTP